jgi:hypothetical protein
VIGRVGGYLFRRFTRIVEGLQLGGLAGIGSAWSLESSVNWRMLTINYQLPVKLSFVDCLKQGFHVLEFIAAAGGLLDQIFCIALVVPQRQ